MTGSLFVRVMEMCKVDIVYTCFTLYDMMLQFSPQRVTNEFIFTPAVSMQINFYCSLAMLSCRGIVDSVCLSPYHYINLPPIIMQIFIVVWPCCDVAAS